MSAPVQPKLCKCGEPGGIHRYHDPPSVNYCWECFHRLQRRTFWERHPWLSRLKNRPGSHHAD